MLKTLPWCSASSRERAERGDRETGEQVVSRNAVMNSRLVSWAGVFLAVVALFWLRWSGVNSGNWADLDVYARGAQVIVAGAPLYEPQASVLPFTYSPFAAVFFTPLHLLNSTGARWVFTLGSLVSYLVAVGAFGWRLRLPRRHLVLVALAGMALEPFVRTMLLGQVNLYLMAAVVVDCLVIRSSHRGMAGRPGCRHQGRSRRVRSVLRGPARLALSTARGLWLPGDRCHRGNRGAPGLAAVLDRWPLRDISLGAGGGRRWQEPIADRSTGANLT